VVCCAREGGGVDPVFLLRSLASGYVVDEGFEMTVASSSDRGA
jgi:hypothetical protein